MEIFEIDPLKIRVRQGLDRFRKDMRNLMELGDSILQFGQIQPIVINKDNELITGGRRLAACILKGLQVKCVYKDTVDPVIMRLWEIEENLQREDFTPAETALAIREFHNLKQKLHGAGAPNTDEGWDMIDTAKELKKSTATVCRNLQTADILDKFPELSSCKTQSEIKKAAKGLQKVMTVLDGAEKHEAVMKKRKGISFQLHNVDAYKHMKTLPNNSIDLIVTDPKYGIDIDEVQSSTGGTTGKHNTTGFKFDDNTAQALEELKVFARESYRITTESAHLYLFVGPEHFWTIRQYFLANRWFVHVKPLIWIKRSTGQCNVPTVWPASCYEMCLYARKGGARLVKEGMPDWIECMPVLGGERRHPTEKPVALITNLLERSALPGQKLYDPFMGSGAVIEAAHKYKLLSIGCDIAKECYAMTLDRMNGVLMREEL